MWVGGGNERGWGGNECRWRGGVMSVGGGGG